MVAALFKAAGYRAWPNYLSVAKQAHIDAGGSWSESLDQLARACTRSVLRGLGPARQSAPLDLNAVAALPRDAAPGVDLGPVGPVRM
eukprot:3595236-Amphidinium_carterae.1